MRQWMARTICVGTALTAIAGQVVADDTHVSTDDKVSRLEQLLQSQQERIDALQTQLAQQSNQNMDAQRTEIMKQQIREVLSEQEFRESLMPSMTTAGYDKGFYIHSTDNKFALKVNGYTQFRFTHYGTRESNRYLLPRLRRDDRTGFDLQRIRLMLTGHAWDEDLTYNLTIRADNPDGSDFVAHYIYANYRVADEFQIQTGLFQLASTRSQLLANNGFQFVDRGLVDAVFGLGNGVGVRLWGQLFNKKLDYFVDVVNSLNGDRNRTITTDPAEHDNNPAILGRLVWHAMGEDPSEWSFESDVNHNETPQLDLGFSYAFNDDQGDRATTKIPFPSSRLLGGSRGGYGLTTTNGLQINQFSWDAGFKYMGFSTIGEYVLRIVDPRRAGRRPFAPWWLLTGSDETTTMHGGYVQLGYFLPIPGMEKKLEAVARVGGISTNGNGQEGSWEYGGGINYYIQGNNVKLQTDVVRIYESPISSSYSSLANVNDDALVWRVQLQVGF